MTTAPSCFAVPDETVLYKIFKEQIDPPKNQHRALRDLRKVEWQVGEDVDDFFYRLKDLSSEANTNLRVACSMFISQMPNSMQTTLLEWLDRQEDMRTGEGRALLVKVKKILAEKDIPSDHGYRELERIAI